MTISCLSLWFLTLYIKKGQITKTWAVSMQENSQSGLHMLLQDFQVMFLNFYSASWMVLCKAEMFKRTSLSAQSAQLHPLARVGSEVFPF